jgi:hypothetical protein
VLVTIFKVVCNTLLAYFDFEVVQTWFHRLDEAFCYPTACSGRLNTVNSSRASEHFNSRHDGDLGAKLAQSHMTAYPQQRQSHIQSTMPVKRPMIAVRLSLEVAQADGERYAHLR